MVYTGCRYRRAKISLVPVNGSGAIGWLYQTLEQPGKILAAALERTVLLGAARLPAVQPKTARTSYSASLGPQRLEPRRQPRRSGLHQHPGRVRRLRPVLSSSAHSDRIALPNRLKHSHQDDSDANIPQTNFH